ncbi:MAG: hypothetical protein KGJ23_13905 [Euryarchaeota archaeon]|nr:hypothetical protein [Euryarchaeota archaeon]MDE1837692.1 hypothetical protein [Euryarchaeota archaeon]MDE1881790.1 hypothetical protein [Euryarchaeota archaeon]MDE2045978.1 hypothetical protein [Thermoplasmata archaeon]
MPGTKVTKVGLVPVTTRFPAALHRDMVRAIEGANQWVDQCDFIREAVREKLDRMNGSSSKSVVRTPA